MQELEQAIVASFQKMADEGKIQAIIESKIEKTVDDVIDHALRSYSDFGKELTAAIEGSLNYPGHPAEPPEIELETIFWPITHWDAEQKIRVDDHIEMPLSGLPDAVAEAVEAHICEHYDGD
ncbi:MAG: hypothetical protein V3U60_16485 [Gammaproteobacteria bacterium]